MSFVSPRRLTFPEAKPRGTLRSRPGPGINCFVVSLQLKTGKTTEKSGVCFTRAGSQICRGFNEHDLITCESKVHVVVSPGS